MEEQKKTQGNARGFGANLIASETFEEAKAAGTYFQFELKAKKGYKLSIHSITSIMHRQELAANKYRWVYSLDGKNFKELGEEVTLVTFVTFENKGKRQPRLHTKKIKELQNISSSKKKLPSVFMHGVEKLIWQRISILGLVNLEAKETMLFRFLEIRS